ncbi:MAG: hypothetical protein ACJAQT_004504 [Akkermansiaceae bacterium]|jgi:hypothetical protein
MGIRNFQGSIQDALAEVMAAKEALYVKLNSMRLARDAFKRKLQTFSAITENPNGILGAEVALLSGTIAAESAIDAFNLSLANLDNISQSVIGLTEVFAEAPPIVLGVSNDGTSTARAASIAHRRALENSQNKLIDGDTVLVEHESFRKRAAAVIQGARVRDVGFRAFRTESLE